MNLIWPMRYPTAFLKTHFCLESVFCSYQLHRNLWLDEPVFRVLNTMAKVWKLQHSLFLRFPTAFSQNTFLLRKWLSFVPRAPEFPTSMFSGVLKHNGKGLKALAFTISEILHCMFLKTCFSLEIGFLLFLELQKSLLVSFQGCWTKWWAIKQRYFEYC